MQPGELEERVELIRELIREIHHAALATVNADGSPHLSPVFAAFDESLRVFWSSHPQAQHSRNIARTGQVFITLFDSRTGHGGLYIQASAGMLTQSVDIEAAEKLHAQTKRELNGQENPPGVYPNDKNYRAIPQRMWINRSERSPEGLALRDHRHEIKLEDLIHGA